MMCFRTKQFGQEAQHSCVIWAPPKLESAPRNPSLTLTCLVFPLPSSLPSDPDRLLNSSEAHSTRLQSTWVSPSRSSSRATARPTPRTATTSPWSTLVGSPRMARRASSKSILSGLLQLRILTSSRFDSSVGRGDFDVPIGTGRVIKGWDEGIVKEDGGMSLGEKATLTISRYVSIVFDHTPFTNQSTATTVTVTAGSPVPSPLRLPSSSVSACQRQVPRHTRENHGCVFAELHWLTETDVELKAINGKRA
jgi:hypothetical protein